MEQKKQKSLWRSSNGHVRLIWLLLIGFAVYLIWEHCFEAIGEFALEKLNAACERASANGQSAIWLDELRTFAGPVISLIGAVGIIAIFVRLKKWLHGEEEVEKLDAQAMMKWFCIGLAGALAGTLLCLITDSLRLAPSDAEVGLEAVLALPVCFAVTLAGEVFMMEYVYESAHLHRKRVFCVILVICAELLEQRAWRFGAIGAVNVALKALVCCLMHVTVGLAATTGLWFGWSYVLSILIGLSGCMWTVYHVSEPWLTGGSNGLFCGLCATVFMLGVIAYICLKYVRKKAY